MAQLELDEVHANAVDYQHFLLDSPTPYHAAEVVAQRLVDAGFTRVDEKGAWDASPGGHVMVRGGAVAAWFVPETVAEDAGFRIVGAHTDSPALSVKPSVQSTTPDGWGQIDVEVYGGMMWNSWLDRELTLAGRLVLTSGEVVLARTGPIARIPQLAIHLDRDVNPVGLKLDPQKHLHPVWTVDNPTGSVLEHVAQSAGLEDASQVAAFDLILTPSQGPGFFGDKGQFVAASRQDNLSSVHPGLVALERLAAEGTPAGGDVVVFMCFDHEEVGSGSRTGAAGPNPETGARRGTAYHKVFETIDFGKDRNEAELKLFLDELERRGALEKEDRELLSAEPILNFLSSELAARMARADRENKLHRESSFVLAVPAREADPSVQSEEAVVVQGVIDAWFEENGELILLDYKTDRNRDPEHYRENYTAQLSLYARALEMTEGKRVAQKLIYALGPGELLTL